MRHALRLFTLLVLLAPGSAQADGVNLAWDQCWPEGGSSSKRFACDRDSGAQTLVGSFVVNEAVSDFAGLGVIINGSTSAAELPAWWQMYNAGSCRQSALSVSFDFLDAPGTACRDLWGGLATGGIAAYQTTLYPPPPPLNVPRPNRFRLKLAAVPPQPDSLEAVVEYYAFRLRISHAKTTGLGACAGCLTDVCLWLDELSLVSGPGGSFWKKIYTAQNNNLVMWQTPYWWSCAVPARSRTWGSVKALYR